MFTNLLPVDCVVWARVASLGLSPLYRRNVERKQQSNNEKLKLILCKVQFESQNPVLLWTSACLTFCFHSFSPVPAWLQMLTILDMVMLSASSHGRTQCGKVQLQIIPLFSRFRWGCLETGQSTLPYSINKEQLTTGTKLNPVAVLWRKPQGQEAKHPSSTNKPSPSVALSPSSSLVWFTWRGGIETRAKGRRGRVNQLCFPPTHYLKKGTFPPAELSRDVLAHS